MRINSEMPVLDIAGAVRPGGDGARVRPDGGISGFTGELKSAIQTLDRLQLEADREVGRVAEGAGNLHEMAIALEKADVAMRLAMKVRNKIVETYNEIMRMGI